MSSTPTTIRNAVDAWTNSAAPSRNYSDQKRVWIKASAGYVYLYFNRPFPIGATVVSATLRVYTSGAWGGISPTLTAKRVDAPWKVSKITWDTQPNVIGTGGTLTKSSNVDADEWAIDVTAQMQAIADGGTWYGLRLVTTDTTLRPLYSANSLDYKPTLSVTWATNPEPPSTLLPSGARSVSINKPVLRFDFTDELGNTAMQAAQVQINPTNAWTAPAFDSGVYTTTEPELDLSTFSYVRTQASVAHTISSTAITGPSGTFVPGSDVGAAISGTGIPAGATIASVTSSTAATLSANATTTATVTATITRSYAGLANGATTYWRAQVQDGSGLWSGWSDAAQFDRDNKGTLTITNPAASPNNFVTEFTPPVSWTLTGETQTGWQVLITATDDRSVVYYDSGRTKGTVTAHTIPKGNLKDNRTYQLIVRIWDSKDRESTPGDKSYTETTRDFTVNESATTAPVTALTSTASLVSPWVTLNWTRSTAPDTYTIKRDGTVIDSLILPSDVLVSGTSYSYTDKEAGRGNSHTWIVQSVVNGIVSASNPSTTATPAAVGIWLNDNDRNIQVLLTNTDGSTWGMGEAADTYNPIGSAKSIRITQSLRGWEGTVQGMFVDIMGKTADQWANNLLNIRSHPGAKLVLHVGDEAFKCVIGNVNVSPTGQPPGTRNASFDFWQISDLTYETRL